MNELGLAMGNAHVKREALDAVSCQYLNPQLTHPIIVVNYKINSKYLLIFFFKKNTYSILKNFLDPNRIIMSSKILRSSSVEFTEIL